MEIDPWPSSASHTTGAGARFYLSPVDLYIGEGLHWHALSLWPKASGATHPGKFWFCLERNDFTDALKSSAVLCFPCVFSLLVSNAFINATTVWSQTSEVGYRHIVFICFFLFCVFFNMDFCSVRPFKLLSDFLGKSDLYHCCFLNSFLKYCRMFLLIMWCILRRK